jgi:hypothetical protein
MFDSDTVINSESDGRTHSQYVSRFACKLNYIHRIQYSRPLDPIESQLNPELHSPHTVPLRSI